MKIKHKSQKNINIERIQTGVRLEKRLIKVLKGLAEAGDMNLGELLEIISIHALEREHAFTQDVIPLIKKLKEIYGMNYDIHSYKRFKDE